MDPVSEIKARLPIEQLVGQYCQLKKKGRNFVCLCPFHNDTDPSLLVSPDKGIAYCFACSKGGDIFSFTQLIERVDFVEALKILAEKTGVELKDEHKTVMKKDEKERLRECLACAQRFFRDQLKSSESAKAYLEKRHIPLDQHETFGLGYAPDSFNLTYDHLLKEGFSRSEIVAAGLGIQRELAEGKIYDRFRNRVMFPISDAHGNLIAFGGRTLGDDDAKYINSSESPLFNKSAVLFGLHLAKEAIREANAVIMVEGYFDVLACHRVGCRNVVAVSGTALTEQHVKVLRRQTDTAILCLDSDRAGRAAAERAFSLLVHSGFLVKAVSIREKDPDEAANADPALLQSLLNDGGVPYLELVLEELKLQDHESVAVKRAVLARLMPLLAVLASSVERSHYLTKAAALLSTTETALSEDLARAEVAPPAPSHAAGKSSIPTKEKTDFSSQEIALALFLLYPDKQNFLVELIEPDEPFSSALYRALKAASPSKDPSGHSLGLSEEHAERLSLLLLYCDFHEFSEWSDGIAVREIRKNCARANHEFLHVKQVEIAAKLKEAHLQGKTAEAAQLETQYLQVLKLARMAL